MQGYFPAKCQGYCFFASHLKKQTLRKISKYHLISWYGHCLGTHIFCKAQSSGKWRHLAHFLNLKAALNRCSYKKVF